MRSLHKDQSGVAHLLLILVFVVVLVGISGYAYTRISDKQAASSETSDTAVIDVDDTSDIVDLETAQDDELSQEEAADSSAGDES